MRLRHGLWILGWLFCLNAGAQERPKGGFVEAETQVGQVVTYTLTYRHPTREEILMPDSTADFGAFEYVGHEWFATSTREGLSVDSAVYQVRTFETTGPLALALPVRLLRKGQEILLMPLPVDIRIASVLPASLPDTAQVKAQADYMPVVHQPDRLLWGSIAGAVLLALLLLLAVSWKKIRRRWIIRRLRERHQAFLRDYEAVTGGAVDRARLEEALSLWKKYTGQLTQLPLASFTAKETAQLLAEPALAEHLGRTDLALYAGQYGEQLNTSLSYLRTYAEQAYQRAIADISHEQ